MCDVSTAVYAAAAVFSAYAANEQGKQSQYNLNYQAKVDQNNAQIQSFAADDAAKRGQLAEDAHRDRVRQVLGTQKAAMAASGGDLTDQSSINVLSDTSRAGELDALTIRANAAREAWGLKVGESNSLNDSAFATTAGSQAATAGRAQAGSTLLSGSAQAYSNYNKNNSGSKSSTAVR